jgi:hypothetical protein
MIYGVRRRAFVLAVLCSGLVVAEFGSSPRALAEPRTNEARFMARTNALRARQGLVPLVADTQMTDVARAWSDVMARQGDISHNPNLQKEVTDWVRLGENVGVGPSVDAIQNAFEASPGHYQNLVDPRFRNIGVGVTEDQAGTIWVTVDFKTPNSGPAVPQEPGRGSDPGAGQPPPPSPPPTQGRAALTRALPQPVSAVPLPVDGVARVDTFVAPLPARQRVHRRLGATAVADPVDVDLPLIGAAFVFIAAAALLLQRRLADRDPR